MRKVTSKLQVTLPKRIAESLRLFDEATARQTRAAEQWAFPQRFTGDRDWTREDLYTRGSP